MWIKWALRWQKHREETAYATRIAKAFNIPIEDIVSDNQTKEMDNISNHITYSEATKSNTAIKNGIENIPNEIQKANMKLLAINVFEPLRNHYGKPIPITSFFRSTELNAEAKGSKTSQHMANDGAAMDIDIDGLNSYLRNADLYNYIKKNLPFDQLIWEFGTEENPAWVHVSFRIGNNRKQCLKAYKNEGRTMYKAI